MRQSAVDPSLPRRLFGAPFFGLPIILGAPRMSFISSGGKPPRAHVPMSESGWGAPTPEFRQHHDIAQPEISPQRRHAAWTIASRFLSLHPDEATISAAERWYSDWVYGLEGVRDQEKNSKVDGQSTYGLTDARLDALSRLTSVRESIGSFNVRLLYWCLVEDKDWTEVGKRIGCEYRTARKYTRKALAELVAHYVEADRALRR